HQSSVARVVANHRYVVASAARIRIRFWFDLRVGDRRSRAPCQEAKTRGAVFHRMDRSAGGAPLRAGEFSETPYRGASVAAGDCGVGRRLVDRGIAALKTRLA